MTETLSKQDWEVRPAELKTGQDLVRRFHYSRGGANTATCLHGLFQRGSTACLGAAWWIPPTKGAAIASYDGDWKLVLALSRLVISPEVPKNAASFLMARSIREIRKEGRWKCLVTYADTWRGHTGAVYRATNWEYVGVTKPEAVWVDQNDRMVARKAGPKTRTKQQMLDLGYRMVGRFSKHKFRMVL